MSKLSPLVQPVLPNVTPSPRGGPPVNANLQPTQPYWNGSQFVVPGYAPYNPTPIPQGMFSLSPAMQQRLGVAQNSQQAMSAPTPVAPPTPPAPQQPMMPLPGQNQNPMGGMMGSGTGAQIGGPQTRADPGAIQNILSQFAQGGAAPGTAGGGAAGGLGMFAQGAGQSGLGAALLKMLAL